MTKDEFLNSQLYVGKILFVDAKTNVLWTEELLSSNSKKAKALLKKFPKGGTFTKAFTIKFIVKGESSEFDLGLPEEPKEEK